MSGTVDTPYLGSRISLISKAKIRYEGILYAIDTENMTVALTKVRSFGTEDRNPERPVPPRDETFEYIIFRGTDIFDLTVCDLPQDRLPQDPAILGAAQQPPAPIGSQGPGQAPGYFPPAQQQKQPFGGPQSPVPATSPSNEPVQHNKDRRDSGERERRTNRSYNQNNQDRRGNQNRQQGNWNKPNNQNNRERNNQQAKQPTKFEEDFNFEAANAEFEKLKKDLDQKLKISLGVNKEKTEDNDEEVDEEIESGEIVEGAEEEEQFYNKTSSFFDNISCESNDPQGERITRSAERKLNCETFGIPLNRQFGGRGRGRGRGGNWRGNRGGYRGGYNNQNRSNQGNWRQGHDNRADNRNQNREGGYQNNREGYNNNRGGYRNNDGENRRGGNRGGHWRGGYNNNRGGYRGGRGGYRNQNQDGGDNRNNRNNKNREWVDYEYDVSKAREKQSQPQQA